MTTQQTQFREPVPVGPANDLAEPLAETGAEPLATQPFRLAIPRWGYLAGSAIALLILLVVYGPALRGQFVFDDLFLPYSNPIAAYIPLKVWLGVRPDLGFSFWTDFQLWGTNTLGYHLSNLVLHFASSVVLVFVFRKLLSLASTPDPERTILAVFGSALFLLHPLQTEVAAYIASRSEALSVLFFLSAFCAFLYRRKTAIDWPGTALVLLFFILAVGSKEHTVTLPALLLLTDYFWNPGLNLTGIRNNARLYIPIALLGVAGAILVFTYISSDPMIGFHIPGLGPGAYFLTECRAIFKYLQLFVLPAAQTVDYDFPISHSLTEHGALFALAGLVFLVFAAVLFRKLYPFAAYGFLAFLLLLSPTSSIVPIHDVLVERRMYLPFFALVLILFEPLRRLRIRPAYLIAPLAMICCVAAYATWERAHVWSSAAALFRDATSKSPAKLRVHMGYANALYHEGKCKEAIEEYKNAGRVQEPDFIMYFNMAAAYDCAGQTSDAIDMLDRSIALHPRPNAYTLLGRMQSKQRKFPESLKSFQKSLDFDPRYTPAYIYRAAVYIVLGQSQAAYADYKQCLYFDPQNQSARQGIAYLTQRR